MPIEPGTVRIYESSNGKFQARVSYGQHGTSSLSLYEMNTERWRVSHIEHPGTIAVSDNGQTVVMTTFGWEDEGGASGLAIFNAKGDPLKPIEFSEGNLSKAGIKWVKVLQVSSDGKYIAVGEGLRENSKVTVYDAQTGFQVLNQEAGYQNCVGISMSLGAERTLLATRNNESGMIFALLDKTGKILGSKMIDKNFSYNVPVYVKFQENRVPEIFDLKSGKFVTEAFDISLTEKVK
jgi:hypothetical protein